MAPLNIAFLWHMHQPYYRDPESGGYALPWVRMHATKGYYDMIAVLDDYPGVRQTFNLVPSLLIQLEEYARGSARDLYLDHALKPAAELTPEQKSFLLASSFLCNWETMVKPYPEYWNLLRKRGLRPPREGWGSLIQRFSTQEYRDLQVWFNLTWFGHRARKENEFVRALLAKGKNFSEEDKTALFAAQQEILEKVILRYRSARSRGQVEITVSPFYHPILPLLIDWRHASRAMPGVRLPGSFAHPEDARAQIRKAVALYDRIFASRPEGMWPSEGSVSPELVPLMAQAGIRWMASDEGVLFRSLPPGAGREQLYRPYRVRHEDSEVTMAFRDRNLSDLIGFTYAKNPPRMAAQDVIGHLRRIQKSAAGEGRLVLIALDGENPWEAYPDGGEEFLRYLYEGLSAEEGLATVRMNEFLSAYPPRETIHSLHSGSWIDANFRIWIGSREDNLAWESLNRTRQFLEKVIQERPGIAPPEKEQAWEEIYIAEGSDWFWWFGDDFTSENDEEFDRLFRRHLSRVYLLLEEEVPAHLKRPISLPRVVEPTVKPRGLIHPVLDGRVTHFYEWQNAGYFETGGAGGSMYRGAGPVSGFYYGFDLENLYFRIDLRPALQESLSELSFRLHLLTPPEWRLAFPASFPAGEEAHFILKTGGDGGDGGSGSPQRFSTLAADKIVELGLPFAALGLHPREEVQFFLTVLKGGLEVERRPRSGYLALNVPDQDYESDLWLV